MLVFIINKIGQIDFIDENKFKNIFDLSNDFFIWKNIHWWILNLSKEEFVEKLPLLNGFVSKYWFINEVLLPVNSKLIKLQNVYEIEFDEKTIKQIPFIIEKIKKYIKQGKLLTKSKKEEFKHLLDNAVYLILQNIIKLYFIIYDAVKNKEKLKKILETDNVLAEYKAQANLLEYTSSINIEKMISRLNFLIKQLNILSTFFSQFAKEFNL